ncbi:MAG: hypothetical protein ACPG6V_07885 [Flavobacteriales bacterium]
MLPPFWVSVNNLTANTPTPLVKALRTLEYEIDAPSEAGEEG